MTESVSSMALHGYRRVINPVVRIRRQMIGRRRILVWKRDYESDTLDGLVMQFTYGLWCEAHSETALP